VFKLVLLKTIIKHQDKPRTVYRLRNQFVTFDPRQWNADMDALSILASAPAPASAT
jgi:hypothetical protein